MFPQQYLFIILSIDHWSGVCTVMRSGFFRVSGRTELFDPNHTFLFFPSKQLSINWKQLFPSKQSILFFSFTESNFWASIASFF